MAVEIRRRVMNRKSKKEEQMSNAVEVNDATFEQEVLKADRPVMVDFWAVWCGPCRQISPIVEDLAAAYQDRVKIAKVDVDTSPNVAMKYSIRSIPTILFFRDGKVVDSVIGAYPRAEYDRRLKNVLG
jgi:thioredoxin 1